MRKEEGGAGEKGEKEIKGGGGECKGERRRKGRISKEKVRMWRKKLPKKPRRHLP